MHSQRNANRPMFVGGAGLIVFGLFMVVQGILHIISGEPIPDVLSEPMTGWDSFFAGLLSIALGAFAIRLGFRGAPRS